MPKCVTCGSELHPERALKYDYCMAPECQEKNAKGLTMVAVGVNKAAEQFMILDDRAREELASGKYHDQRRGSFGPPARSPGAGTATAGAAAAAQPARRQPAPDRRQPAPDRRQPAPDRRQPAPDRRQARAASRRPWTRSQEKLALLYNQQRLRPEEIAQKLGLSTYTVTQIILTARNQGKL